MFPVILSNNLYLFSRHWDEYFHKIKELFTENVLAISRDDAQVLLLIPSTGKFLSFSYLDIFLFYALSLIAYLKYFPKQFLVESKMIISFGILPFYQNYYKIIQKTLYN